MTGTRLAGVKVAGIVTLEQLLHARLHDLTEEHHRERVLRQSADAVPSEV